MKTCIRRGLFETNSSSAHSFLVTENDRVLSHDDLIPPEEADYGGELHLFNGELSFLGQLADGFERTPFTILTTFKEKLAYYICSFCGHMEFDNEEDMKVLDDIFATVKEIVPEIKSIYYSQKDVPIYTDEDGDIIHKRDMTYVGWDDMTFEPIYFYVNKQGEKVRLGEPTDWLRVPDIGEVDHESQGLLKWAMEKEGITLREFLLNKKYCVVIDGDEYEIYEKLMDNGFLNKDFVLRRYKANGEIE